MKIIKGNSDEQFAALILSRKELAHIHNLLTFDIEAFMCDVSEEIQIDDRQAYFYGFLKRTYGTQKNWLFDFGQENIEDLESKMGINRHINDELS